MKITKKLTYLLITLYSVEMKKSCYVNKVSLNVK